MPWDVKEYFKALASRAGQTRLAAAMMLALEAITLSWWCLLAEHAPSVARVIVQDHTAPGRGGCSQPLSLQQCDRQNASLQDGLGCQPAKPI